MRTAIAQFLQYMRVERNASDLTVKSYREDLELLADYLSDSSDRCPGPSEISTGDLRSYVASLNEV